MKRTPTQEPQAPETSASFQLAGIPQPLRWHNRPVEWSVGSHHALRFTAGKLSDLFVSPDGKRAQDDSPAALFAPPRGDFLFSAKVTVDFRSRYDAGALQIRAGENLWAKICFEYSHRHEPTIVSVVTRGRSDDADAVTIPKNEVFLRIAKIGYSYALHYSTDAQFWRIVRHFTLGESEPEYAGFSSQSPRGEGCAVKFSDISFITETLRNMRSGE